MTKSRDIASAIPAPSTVSSAELGFLDGVTSAIQTQVDAKAPSSTAVTLTGTQTLTNKTLTNPVISSVINNTLTSTTGDIIYASGANTPARLGIGSSAQVLTVASGVPSWATPAAGGGMTSIASGSLSTNSLSLSSISASYKDLVLVFRDWYYSGISGINLRFNGDTASNYQSGGYGISTGTTSLTGNLMNRIEPINGDAIAADNNNSLILTIFDYANTTARKQFQVQTAYYANGNVQFSSFLTGAWIATPAAINAMTLAVSNGAYSYSGGTYILYGVN